jgi:putative phosphoesterase
MKWLIASDIHGSFFWCRKLLEKFRAENCSRILLLGDILYHGPRNNLPDGYDPKKVAEILNEIAEKIVCVRGNCDSEVDSMVLNFETGADYTVLDSGKNLIFATHGHIFNEKNPPKFAENSVLLCGHFHVPAVHRNEKFVYLNAGSVSIPKENSFHSYVIFDGENFVWKDLNSAEEKLRFSLSDF